MSKMQKKGMQGFKLLKQFLAFFSAVSGCVSFSGFASLVDVPFCIASSAVRLNICAITVGIKKKSKLYFKKKKKKKTAQLYSVIRKN